MGYPILLKPADHFDPYDTLIRENNSGFIPILADVGERETGENSGRYASEDKTGVVGISGIEVNQVMRAPVIGDRRTRG